MIPFHRVVIPHDDILKGNLNLDKFAEDLEQVFLTRNQWNIKFQSDFSKKPIKHMY
jgi:hypothetical protein